MTNTRPVLNLLSPIVDIIGNKGYLRAPWNSFFQQFVQNAPAVQDNLTSPFTANQNGTVIITGAGTGIKLTRGSITINLANGQAIIPVSISDTVEWTGGVPHFLGD